MSDVPGSPASTEDNGVTAIEVTPEMIEAGCEAYARCNPDSYCESVDRIAVVRIYEAMVVARLSSSGKALRSLDAASLLLERDCSLLLR